MVTITLTPPQLHEVVKALHHNRNRIWVRLRRTKRQLIELTEDSDPSRRLYLETLETLRLDRVDKIDKLLQELEPLKEQ